MLNRRHLRIKTMQALYAFFCIDENNVWKSEKELFRSIEKVHDLYIYLLLLIIEIVRFAEQHIEHGKQKHLATKEDKNPNTKLINNLFVKQLAANKQLNEFIQSKRLSWSDEQRIIKKIYFNISTSEDYKKYINSKGNSYKADVKFITKMFYDHIVNYDILQQFLEEKNIYWVDNIEPVNHLIHKTFKSFNADINKENHILKPYKDKEEDKNFVSELFRMTINHSEKYEKLIGKKAEKWEIDRIAKMDIILMKMAICEILNFSSIPVKVTLNEYIEIAKEFSTHKSKIFINGILDKLLADFKKSKKFKKTGRGLID